MKNTEALSQQSLCPSAISETVYWIHSPHLQNIVAVSSKHKEHMVSLKKICCSTGPYCLSRIAFVSAVHKNIKRALLD